MKKLSIICLSFLLLALSTPVSAQFQTPNINQAQLPLPEIQLKPAFPEPGDKVTASISINTQRFTGSDTTWMLNGVEIPESNNLTKVSFTAVKNGEDMNLIVILSTPIGINEVIKKTISPRYVDIIVEPQTHVPNFYLGRPMPSLGSITNATVLISGRKNYQDLMFTWRVGRVVIGENTLRGRNMVSYDTPWDKNTILSVDIAKLDGTLIASKYIVVPSVSPYIRFYESSALLGLKTKPINKSLFIVGNTAVVRAEPYFLDSRVYNEPDILEWKVDRILYNNTGQNPYEVTLQKNIAGGNSNLEFHVRNTSQVLQGAKARININL